LLSKYLSPIILSVTVSTPDGGGEWGVGSWERRRTIVSPPSPSKLCLKLFFSSSIQQYSNLKISGPFRPQFPLPELVQKSLKFQN
jgi:hypothetical protein